MSILRTLTAASIIIINCVGSGALTCATLLYPSGYNAFVGWLITGLGALCMASIFLILTTEQAKNNLHTAASKNSMHETVAANFTKNHRIVKILVLYLYTIFATFSNAALANLVCLGLKSYINPFLSYGITFAIIYFINRYKVDISYKINLCLSAIKFGLLVGLPLICIYKLTPVAMEISFVRFFSPALIMKASFKAIWPFVGAESIAIDTGLSTKYLKRGLFLGIFACLLIYLLNTYVMFFYVPNLQAFDIGDQKLIMEIAPSCTVLFNIFIAFLGFSCLHGWTQTVNSVWDSAGNLAPEYAKRYANEITCFFGMLSSVAIKLYRPHKSFDFIFDAATILLLIIYYLGMTSFILGWRWGRIQPTITEKLTFFCAILYLFIVSSGLFLALIY